MSNITRLTKILFLVDTSGSNAIPTRNNGTLQCLPSDPDYKTACAMPTDPDKTFRAGAINTFLNTYGGKTNFDWSFATFSKTSAHAYISFDGDDQNPAFLPGLAPMQAAIAQFMQVVEWDATPYRAALQMAQKAVANDADLDATSHPQYFILMLTDGRPTDYNTNGNIDIAAVQGDINALLNVAPNRVTLSTVYYGEDSDSGAKWLLQNMANLGKGQFDDVRDTSQGIQVNDVVPVTICQ